MRCTDTHAHLLFGACRCCRTLPGLALLVQLLVLCQCCLQAREALLQLLPALQQHATHHHSSVNTSATHIQLRNIQRLEQACSINAGYT
jgi:hypothetical protein